MRARGVRHKRGRIEASGHCRTSEDALRRGDESAFQLQASLAPSHLAHRRLPCRPTVRHLHRSAGRRPESDQRGHVLAADSEKRSAASVCRYLRRDVDARVPAYTVRRLSWLKHGRRVGSRPGGEQSAGQPTPRHPAAGRSNWRESPPWLSAAATCRGGMRPCRQRAGG